MADITESLMADTKPRTATAKVCVDGELFAQLMDLQRQMVEEQQNLKRLAAEQKRTGAGDAAGDPGEMESRRLVDEAREGIEALLDAAEACTYEFRFRSIGPRWKKLKETHAPPRERVKEAREQGQPPPEFGEGFWPAALAESLEAVRKVVDEEWQPVDWDVDKLGEVTAAWNDAQRAELEAACRQANEWGNAVPGKDSSFARSLISAAKPASPETSAGPAASSTDGD